MRRQRIQRIIHWFKELGIWVLPGQGRGCRVRVLKGVWESTNDSVLGWEHGQGFSRLL